MFKFRSFLCLTAALCLGLAVTACSPQEEVEVAPADTEVVAPDAEVDVDVEAPVVEPATAPVLGGEVTEEAAPVEAAPMEAAPETIAPATMPAATAPVM